MSKKFYFIVINLNKKIIIVSLIICFISIVITLLISNKHISVFNNNYYCNGKIVIDPGHGGIDGGTSDKSGLLEKNINLDIGLKLKKVLLEDNIKVIMTREKDISLEKKSNINASRYKRDLDARKKIINNNNPNAFISVHVNASVQTRNARGIQVYYYPSSNDSKRLAQLICESINQNLYQKHLKLTKVKACIIPEDYFILRETEYPGVLIETGFITNTYDKKLLMDKTYKEVLAKAIKKGILDYMN